MDGEKSLNSGQISSRFSFEFPPRSNLLFPEFHSRLSSHFHFLFFLAEKAHFFSAPSDTVYNTISRIRPPSNGKFRGPLWKAFLACSKALRPNDVYRKWNLQTFKKHAKPLNLRNKEGPSIFLHQKRREKHKTISKCLLEILENPFLDPAASNEIDIFEQTPLEGFLSSSDAWSLLSFLALQQSYIQQDSSNMLTLRTSLFINYLPIVLRAL